ncbi:MAG: hypothetical protein P3W90_002835 [Paracoccus sp. (in: a-proteobacteria)]|nr:hypothetical protein [Paracoccus sp. (in: a-proteobacteria)]
MIRVAAPLLLLALASCGPVPVAQAERSCLADAQAALGPKSEVAIGMVGGRGGVSPYGKVSLEVSSDYLAGRDPAEAYDRCVMRRSGQMPTRPLYDQPGWRR